MDYCKFYENKIESQIEEIDKLVAQWDTHPPRNEWSLLAQREASANMVLAIIITSLYNEGYHLKVVKNG